jgi:hypothetical protein
MQLPGRASSHSKVIQIVVGEGENEAQALQRVAAEKAGDKAKV